MPTLTSQDIAIGLPLTILAVGSLVLLFLGGGAKQANRQPSRFAAVFTLYLLVGGFLALVPAGPIASPGLTVFHGLLFADPFSLMINTILVLSTVVVVLLSSRFLESEGIRGQGEFYSLLVMSLIGAMIFCSASELITLFVGLEIMSIALYALCGSALSSPRSSESAMKYFLLGSFSSAFLLYGIALMYGMTGSTSIEKIAALAGTVDPTLFAISVGLILVGLAFKIGAVPFHLWVPDVYQGAPTPVTAFMACVVKTAAVAATLRVLWGGFGGKFIYWSGAVWMIAVLTMTIGNLLALKQRSVKRMLACSSIAHAGYLLMAFLAPGESFGGGAAIVFYLVGYTAMTLGAFAVVLLVTASRAGKNHPDDITVFNGLASRRPALAALMALFLLSLAGIPPGMVGLMAKFYLFNAVVHANYTGLAIIAVINSAISCYYYLYVIVAMYFVESEEGASDVARVDFPVMSALCVCALATVFLGLFPSTLYGVAQYWANSLWLVK